MERVQKFIKNAKAKDGENFHKRKVGLITFFSSAALASAIVPLDHGGIVFDSPLGHIMHPLWQVMQGHSLPQPLEYHTDDFLATVGCVGAIRVIKPNLSLATTAVSAFLMRSAFEFIQVSPDPGDIIAYALGGASGLGIHVLAERRNNTNKIHSKA